MVRVSVKNRLALVIATFFGSGYSPFAPGTAGTLAAVPIHYFLLSHVNTYTYIMVVLALTIVGIWASDVAVGLFSNKDPRQVVIDEVCGYFVTMFLVPLSVTSVVLGFFLFRAFDILKPPPARQFEDLPGGIGIVADDLMAGVYANIVLQVVIRFDLLEPALEFIR